MKKLLFLLSALILVASCSTGGYKIDGTVTGDIDSFQNTEVILVNSARNEPITDTAYLNNGKFTFTGVVQTPENYTILISGTQSRVRFFLENANYKISMDLADITLNKVEGGGETTQIIKKIEDKTAELEAQYNIKAILEEYYLETTTGERKEEISKIIRENNVTIREYTEELVKENPNTHFALSQLMGQMSNFSYEELKEKAQPFITNEKFAGNRNIKEVEERIETLSKILPGMPAIDFKQPDPDGNMIALSSVWPKNKLTMVDFWAGWCGPCRRFNPTLVELYKKYKPLGLEILGVSFDRDRETWLQAIKDDKLPWLQISEVKYWDTEPRYLYAINFIPNNLFVDSEGKIVARQLGEEQIIELLKERLEK